MTGDHDGLERLADGSIVYVWPIPEVSDAQWRALALAFALRGGAPAPEAPAGVPAVDALLSEADVAARLGVSVRTLRRRLPELPEGARPMSAGPWRLRQVRKWRASQLPALFAFFSPPTAAPTPPPKPTPPAQRPRKAKTVKPADAKSLRQRLRASLVSADK